MKNHFEEITHHIKILNKLWKTRYSNAWQRVQPQSKTYLKYANQVLEWAIGENKNFLNPKYKDIKIEYSIDENGFRRYPNYKPTNSKKIFTYGCSMTFGFSAPDEHNWPYLLANKLGSWNVKNYGVPAAGADQIARVVYQSLNSIDKKDYPDAVFVLLPDIFRTEYIGNEGTDIFNNSLNLHWVKYPTKEDILRKKFSEDEINHIITERKYVNNTEINKLYYFYDYTCAVHSFFETVKALKLIREVLESKNIPWFWYTWQFSLLSLKPQTIKTFLGTNTILDEEGYLKVFKQTNERRGRDGTHAGYSYLNELAENFLQIYKNYETNKNIIQ